MFIDYYAILGIDERATQEDIKLAFKKQVLMWHPDRNLNADTTRRMQEINEAYLILKDLEAKLRYDYEYQRFKGFKKENFRQESQKQESPQQSSESKSGQTYSYPEYRPSDDILDKWMSNAKVQAVDLAEQVVKDFKGMVFVGAKAAAKEAGSHLVFQIFIGIIFIIILTLAKSCNN